MSRIKASVLMPVFNAQDTLAETFAPNWLQQQKIKPLVLNYVRNHGVREKCQIFLDNAGYVMGQDYLDVT